MPSRNVSVVVVSFIAARRLNKINNLLIIRHLPVRHVLRMSMSISIYTKEKGKECFEIHSAAIHKSLTGRRSVQTNFAHSVTGAGTLQDRALSNCDFPTGYGISENVPVCLSSFHFTNCNWRYKYYFICSNDMMGGRLKEGQWNVKYKYNIISFNETVFSIIMYTEIS